jgi:hypothetical protein
MKLSFDNQTEEILAQYGGSPLFVETAPNKYPFDVREFRTSPLSLRFWKDVCAVERCTNLNLQQ